LTVIQFRLQPLLSLEHKPFTMVTFDNGVVFLLLAFYLEVRLGNFWQMPLVLSGCFTIRSLLYYLLAVKKQIYIPHKGPLSVLTVFGKKEIWRKQESEIVRRSTNHNPFIAVAHKSNPYGRAYPISPYLNSKKE